MKRREFITLLGGAAVAWPIAASAQQSATPVVAVLTGTSPGGFADLLQGFRQGLKETGYIEGENLTIETRFANNQRDPLPELATQLIRRKVAMIAAGGIAAALAAKAATTAIPIVFAVGDDPVKLGLVESLARPGGNLTGVNFFSVELAAKRLDLLHQLAPAATRIGVLVNPANTLRVVQKLARLGIPICLQFPFDSLVVSMLPAVGQPIGQVPHALVTFSTHVLVFYRR
jgi:ABC-type uncharacterized transport system substrate-binding protein